MARKMSEGNNDTRCHYRPVVIAEKCLLDRREKAGLDSMFCGRGECERRVLLFFMLVRNARHLPGPGRIKRTIPIPNMGANASRS